MDANGYEIWRNGLLKGVMEAYAEISRIEQRMKDLTQQAVNMDVKNLGHVSQITMDVADAYGFEILEGAHMVIRKLPDIQEEPLTLNAQEPPQKEKSSEARYVTYVNIKGDDAVPVIEGNNLEELFAKWQEIESGRSEGDKLGQVCIIDNQPDTGRPYEAHMYEIATRRDITQEYLQNRANQQEIQIKNQEEKPMAENKYFSYAYNVDGSVSKFSGSSIEAIIEQWQKIEAGRDENDKLGHFYLKERNPETGELGSASRYEIATGKDVTPVYLNLPQMDKEAFTETIQQLKEAGAKFSRTKQAWYVTRDQDMSKFEAYLKPVPEGQERRQEASYAYNADGSTVGVPGTDFKEILANWQKVEAERGDDNKLKYFYFKGKNPETGQPETSRYEIATGKDVTPVYLHLPDMGSEKFKQTVQQLKADGAKFNGVKKAWYVTRDQDMSKFKQYLQKPQPRESVLGKLADNRKVASGQPQHVHSNEEHNRDAAMAR